MINTWRPSAKTAALAVLWNTANAAVLAAVTRLLISDPSRFDDVRAVGVHEHVWRHTHLGDKYVTVIIDLTPIRDGTGTSRLLDMVPSRSKQAFKQWLKGRGKHWRQGVEASRWTASPASRSPPPRNCPRRSL